MNVIFFDQKMGYFCFVCFFVVVLMLVVVFLLVVIVVGGVVVGYFLKGNVVVFDGDLMILLKQDIVNNVESIK